MTFGMTLINKPIPNKEDLEWDSTDWDSDFIPFMESLDKIDSLWWCISIEENVSREQYAEMLLWCMENSQYQCGMKYNDDYYNEDIILGYFRHPDDAFAFKLRWS